MKSMIAMAIALASSSVFASPVHIYSRGMSCAAVQNAVSVNGQVILHYGDGLYERVVAHAGYCDRASDEVTEAFYAPASDTGACWAGYTCEASNGR